MKDFKIYLFIASVLLLVYLVAQYNRPKPINWTETLASRDKIPYGTYILSHQLHDIFPGADIKQFSEPVYNVINDHYLQHGTYIIICKDINLTEADYDKLAKFIKKGNDVLISASSFGKYFRKKLKIETGTDLPFTATPGSFRFLNKTLDTAKIYTIDKNISDNYFTGLDTAKATVLGENKFHHYNFLKYTMEKGALFLSPDPLLFTNYSLLKTEESQYASVVLSHLKTDKTLIWDNYYTGGGEGEESLMRVFLKNNALRSAYYIAFLSILIFVLYEIKRRQRIIPIIEPLTNTTLDFVNVVGQVYYEQRNNGNIAQKKAAYFLEYLRTKYQLKTAVLDNEFIATLSQKSGVGTGLIEELLKQITLTRAGVRVTDNDLILLNKNIEQFYLQSR
jgi:hypothetical protein